MTDGWAYFCTDTAEFFIDYADSNNVLHRKQINSKNAETLSGASLAQILNANELEIPSSKAVLDALNEVNEKASVQSDWSVNDETSQAYVKNRTHWEEPPIDTLLVPEQTVSFTLLEEDGFSMYIAEDPFQLDLVEGETYKIVWDGVEYTCNGTVNYDVFGYVDCGNVSFFEENGTNTGEPFFMRNIPPLLIGTKDPAASHTISVYKHAPVIHTLDNKYLNSNVLTLDNYLKAGYTAGKTVECVRESDGVTVEGEIFNDYVYNKAPAAAAHAEGSNTTASGTMSHAEGGGTVASGLRSHAQGFATEAAGADSHAEGDHTVANGKAQHVQGVYNIIDKANNGDESVPGRYAHIVGNGTLSKRSNAHTLDWNGTAWFKGDVKVGGTSQDDAQKLVTQAEVDALFETFREEIGEFEEASTEDIHALFI